MSRARCRRCSITMNVDSSVRSSIHSSRGRCTVGSEGDSDRAIALGASGSAKRLSLGGFHGAARKAEAGIRQISFRLMPSSFTERSAAIPGRRRPHRARRGLPVGGKLADRLEQERRARSRSCRYSDRPASPRRLHFFGERSGQGVDPRGVVSRPAASGPPWPAGRRSRRRPRRRASAPG